MLKKILRRLGFGALVFVILCLVALEVWYRTLLPPQQPQPSVTSSSQLTREMMWLYHCAGQGRPRLRPIYPFLLGSLFRDPHSQGSLAAGVTRLLLSYDKPERPLKRVFRELALATWVSRHWTANEALDTYASLVWMGDGRYGVAEGAAFFFGKDASQLTVAETALLIVMMRSPKAYNPLCHPARARKARDDLLERMLAARLLDQQAVSKALAADLGAQAVCEVT